MMLPHPTPCQMAEPMNMGRKEAVPAFMAILERAAERSKDKEDSGICFTFEELDALAFDPELREFDPDLAEVIRKRHAELFPGIGSP